MYCFIDIIKHLSNTDHICSACEPHCPHLYSCWFQPHLTAVDICTVQNAQST